MDRSDVLLLINAEYVADSYGVQRLVKTETSVFCRDVSSVSASEVFEAGKNGINPELRITMFAHDYNGQTILEYKGKRYGIYRYWVNNDDVELYCERKGGV